MPTLQQIRAKAYLEISQDSSNSAITSAQMDGFINEGVKYCATILQWPRDIIEIQVEDGVGTYTLPTDALMLRLAYFGNRSTDGDTKPLLVCTEESLVNLYPDWLDSTSGSKGRPEVAVLIDRLSVLLHPRPNTVESASGKKLYLSYVYYPAALSSDSDTPDLPLAAHDFLSIFAAHKCYAGPLNNVDLANNKFSEFTQKIKAIEPKVDKPVQQLSWHWGGEISSNGSGDSLANLRLL